LDRNDPKLPLSLRFISFKIFQARHHHEFIDVHPREDIPQSHRQFILGHLQSASAMETAAQSDLLQLPKNASKKFKNASKSSLCHQRIHESRFHAISRPWQEILDVYLEQRRLTTSILVQLSKFLHPRLIDVNWPIQTSMANELAKELLRSSQSKILKIVELCETM
jgi:hypothetical protein